MKAGAVDFLTKALQGGDLMRAVTLRSRKTAAAAKTEIAELRRRRSS
jgi:FixJ family two-component response regulator